MTKHNLFINQLKKWHPQKKSRNVQEYRIV